VSRLSQKEEAFAQTVAAGAKLSDAYRASRDCSKMATATINANAKKLVRKPAVKARIEVLRESPREGFPRGIARARESQEKRESSRESSEAVKTAAPEEPKPQGRPTVYTEKLADAILARLAAGEPLRTICRDEGMPDESTVRAWALDPKHPIAERYMRAREIGLYSMADEILEIADDSRNDHVDRITRSGEVVRAVDEESISRSKVRIAARQWLLSKALPKAFGERLEHTGGLTLDTPPEPRLPSPDRLNEILSRFGVGRTPERGRDDA
jgi:hypothetical protein